MKCLLVGVLCVISFSFLDWVNAVGTVIGNEGQESGTKSVKIKCYLCSWSSTANISNNVDTCSPHRFNPEASVIHPCDHGCQTFSYRNAKNEALSPSMQYYIQYTARQTRSNYESRTDKSLRHFYRNCLKIDKGKEPIDRCIPTKEIPAYGLEDVCQCLTTLCNHSTHLRQFSTKIYFYSAATIFISSATLVPSVTFFG